MNKMIRTLVCGGQISLTVMDTTDLVGDAIKIHSAGREAARILGGLLTCGAYLAADLKAEGSCVSLTVKARESDGAVSVSSDCRLHVRGYADGSCTRTLKGGTLAVVREEYGAPPFVGTCEIASDDLSEIFSAYFQQSEQIPTAVSLTIQIGEDGKCQCAGGVVMQLLPEADDQSVALAGEAFDRYAADGDALSRLGAEGVMEEYFSPLSPSDEYVLFPVYRCNCSEEKIVRVLASVGREELQNIVKEQGAVTVHCHYCNKDYVFDKDRIEKIFCVEDE